MLIKACYLVFLFGLVGGCVMGDMHGQHSQGEFDALTPAAAGLCHQATLRSE
jgi:hypothetical protein